MPIDAEKLLNWPFNDLEHSYQARDTILYALGAGAGSDPLDESDLRFVFEDGLVALPSMAVVLGYPGFWLKDQNTGVDWKRLLHGEQGMVLHRPLPVSGTVIGRTEVTGLVDKGEGKGALLYSKRDVFDKATGDLLATLTSTSFLRGDGGFGGASGATRTFHAIPPRAPDESLELPTLPQAALIYRLSGDYNPLHADPKVAAAAGFPRPILHGLCTYAVACRALLRLTCDNQPHRLRTMDVRFSAPVFPGETIRTDIWRNGTEIAFRCWAVERDLKVLDNGRAEVSM
ncbi:MAG: MaoC/PaaZ C-terminal domain-containing protein [Pseudomonadota bacterium]